MELVELFAKHFPSLVTGGIMVAVYQRVAPLIQDIAQLKKMVRIIVDILKEDNGNAKKILEAMEEDGK